MPKPSVSGSLLPIALLVVAGLAVPRSRADADPPPKAADQRSAVLVGDPRVVPWQHVMALSVAFSPDGKSLAVGSDQQLATLWDPAALREMALLEGFPLPRINDLAFSPDGATLATANGDYHAQDRPGEVWLWNVDRERVRARLAGHNGHVWSVAFTPDGKTVLSAGADGTVKLWDAATGDLKSTLTAHRVSVRRVAVSPDGMLFASGGFDGVIKLWDLAARQVLKSFPAHEQGVNGLVFSPDGKTLVSSGRFPSGDGVAVSVWDAGTIASAERVEPVRNLSQFRGRVLTVAFSPDGRLLATGGGTYGQFGELKLFDAGDGRLVAERDLPKSIDSLAFSPDGKTLATAAGVEMTNGDVLLWKVGASAPK